LLDCSVVLAAFFSYLLSIPGFSISVVDVRLIGASLALRRFMTQFIPASMEIRLFPSYALLGDYCGVRLE